MKTVSTVVPSAALEPSATRRTVPHACPCLVSSMAARRVPAIGHWMERDRTLV
jgi:hypothetical protein